MISFPVDTQNTRWAVYRVSAASVVRTGVKWPRADGGEIIGLDPDLVPLLEVVEAQPAFDPATQRLQATPAVVDVDANTHTRGWVVVDRSAEELAADAERDQIKSVFVALRDGTGTAGERLRRAERVAAHLLKRQYGEVG